MQTISVKEQEALQRNDLYYIQKKALDRGRLDRLTKNVWCKLFM